MTTISNTSNHISWLTMLCVSATFFAACSDFSTQSNQTAQAETSPSVSQTTKSATTANSANTNSDLSWPQPDGWAPLSASSMVLDAYQKETPHGSLKLSISAFPGTVGGDLANVNRWQRQVGLAPVSGENLSSVLKEETIAGRSWKKVSLANNGNALLIAYTMSAGKSWFFKISGSADGVATVADSFDTFLAQVTSK